MTDRRPGPDDGQPTDADATREFAVPSWEPAGDQPQPPPIPEPPYGDTRYWQPQQPGYGSPHPGPDFAYAPGQALPSAEPAREPWPAFAPTPAYGQQPPPTGPDPAYAPPGAGWPPPDPAYAPPGAGWPTPGPPAQRGRGVWLAFGLVGLALIGGLTAVLLIATGSSSSSKTSADGGGAQLPSLAPSAVPSPSPSTVPSTGPSTAPSAGPSSGPSTVPTPPGIPLPTLGQVQTPPGLEAIDYHAYSLELLAPEDVALGPAEEVQFRKYGLSRIVGLRALTVSVAGIDHNYDASINILRFRDAAAAQGELDYSNAQNKKTASTVSLPGLPNATAFVNKGDKTSGASRGVSIGAFITVGRYQVVVILGGLAPNAPTDVNRVAAETAKVMRAVLPDAATIVPEGSSGGGPNEPAFPTPSPSGTHA